MRLSAIGDVCHAAAMVNRIQQHWPDTELTWVIGKIEYQLVKLMPGIRFVIFDKSRGKLAVDDLRRELAGEEFDALLMMQVALRANWASRAIKARRRIGFDWARSKELHWLFANERVAPRAHAHVLEGFMDFADALGVPSVAEPRWSIPLEPEAESWAEAKAKQLGEFVVISPAASKQERNWLPERYASIANHLADKGKKVVLCGGPGPLDRETAKAILSHNPAIAENFVGKTTLHQLLGLIAKADLVIAPDTGPAHMATTVGTPVIGLYAHSNPRRTGPYRDLKRVVSVYDECIEAQFGKPWQSLPWGVRAKGKTLMEQISTEQVMQQVDELLTGNDNR
ncbi:lipopolysaccharide heptosyltransferase family protein [Alteromonas aestuariivivens]|uniref:Lipopolysaccharide heptosyltransferase family protein n=1 Tax=Alteromonas aestuariivivens TaxID=1938339 RepID=A0A3D8M2P1_9ALTE|nr:glycosyltransferase family 9 protein [Alteromonas aestuariivivens]RDV23959.1 lipopolysaccharide heptosyltransferase family protein [Alteromonas aestuariivivens]